MKERGAALPAPPRYQKVFCVFGAWKISRLGQAPTNKLLRRTCSPKDVSEKKPNLKAQRIAGLLLVPPVMHGKLERPRRVVRPKRPRKKKGRFGCGMRFCCWVLQIVFARGVVVSLYPRTRPFPISVYPRTQCEVRLCNEACQ